MAKHIPRWLNEAALREMGDRFEGRIVDVVEQRIHNKYSKTSQMEPVLVFDTGHRLIPNIAQRKALVEFFGPDTRDWHGRRLVVFLGVVERTDKATGLLKVRYEKRVALPSPVALSQVR